MDEGFWHRRWQKNEIGFHEGAANALLARHFGEVFGRGGRVFLPLCGKTRDIGWLLAQGWRVAGAELSRLAVDQLFGDLGVEPAIAEFAGVTRCSADGIDIFVGNILDLTAGLLGPVDVVYDRAALVALPAAMRERYATHLRQLTEGAPQFLVSFAYDQSRMAGPPFSVPGDEIHRLYDDHYDVTRLVSADVAGGLKGKCPATEHMWLLRAA
ncbi:MAG: thiopurine S-methyltransferase [Geminicoccaceae bacterium]|jgi:thiopurine S-methyltransferase|nr:thiopurine S-methyltransferase [Geminicoccaceae bacterium]